MKVPVASAIEDLNYQMFTKKKYGTSQEVIVSILSERHDQQWSSNRD